MPATTWDPGAKSAGINLSGGNLTATIVSGTSNVAATRSLTGPSYGELAVGASLTGSLTVGFVNRLFNFASGTLIGADLNSIGYSNSGAVKINGVTLTTIAAFLATNVICWALNPQTQLVWFRVDAGGWNNDVIGNQNPVGNVGGISLATMTWNSYLPAMGGTTVTPNESGAATFSSGFAQTPPTGYITADTCQTVSRKSIGSYDRPSTVTITTNARAPGSGQGARSSANGGQYTPAATATRVAGTLTEAGVPAAKKVMLFDGRNGDFLGQVISSIVDGSFSIPALGRANVFVVGFDPTTHQAIVYDRITPA